MSTPEAPPVTLFTVEDHLGNVLGGSYDNVSAVSIAVGVYQSIKEANPKANQQVTVFDQTHKAIAYVGYHV